MEVQGSRLIGTAVLASVAVDRRRTLDHFSVARGRCHGRSGAFGGGSALPDADPRGRKLGRRNHCSLRRAHASAGGKPRRAATARCAHDLTANNETTGSTSTATGHTLIKVRQDGAITFKTQVNNPNHETFNCGPHPPGPRGSPARS